MAYLNEQLGGRCALGSVVTLAGETIIDCFGEVCRVISRCTCGAPRYQRPGERGSTIFHVVGCLRPVGAAGQEGHGEAREWTEQAQERDYGEAKARGDFVPSYDAHLARPNPRPDFNLGLKDHE